MTWHAKFDMRFGEEMQFDTDTVYAAEVSLHTAPAGPSKILKTRQKMCESAERVATIVRQWLKKECKQANLYQQNLEKMPKKKSISRYIDGPSSSRELKYLWRSTWQIINAFVAVWPYIFAPMAEAELQRLFLLQQQKLNGITDQHSDAIEYTHITTSVNSKSFEQMSFDFAFFCAINDIDLQVDERLYQHIATCFEMTSNDAYLAIRIFHILFGNIRRLIERNSAKFAQIETIFEATKDLACATRAFANMLLENSVDQVQEAIVPNHQDEEHARVWILQMYIWSSENLYRFDRV